MSKILTKISTGTVNQKETNRMRAVQINGYGGNEVVQVNNVPKPVVEPGKLLIEVYAAGVNPVDWKIREGFLQEMISLKFPATLGGDFSGVILETGDGVTKFSKGDFVYGQANLERGGAFAEFILASPDKIAKKPRSINHLEAASLPLAAVSAWQALVDFIGLKKGQKILIHGGAGGIGSFAIQIAKYFGAYITTTVSEEDNSFVKELGADETIEYKTQKFEDFLQDYDAVFDTVGGDTYARSLQVMKKGGIIVSMLEQPSEELMRKYGVTAFGQFTKVTTERLENIAKLVDKNALKIYIDKIYPLDEAVKALEHLQKEHHRGKAVLEVKSE